MYEHNCDSSPLWTARAGNSEVYLVLEYYFLSLLVVVVGVSICVHVCLHVHLAANYNYVCTLTVRALAMLERKLECAAILQRTRQLNEAQEEGGILGEILMQVGEAADVLEEDLDDNLLDHDSLRNTLVCW